MLLLELKLNPAYWHGDSSDWMPNILAMLGLTAEP
jgi:hypothetical protein